MGPGAHGLSLVVWCLGLGLLGQLYNGLGCENLKYKVGESVDSIC